MPNTLYSPDRKSVDVAPTGVRLPPELRDLLLRESVANNRSLSQEITQRLKASFPKAGDKPLRNQVANGIGEPLHHAAYVSALNSEAINEVSRLMRQLSPEKQLALLTLLKD